jgi:hypothetical protein
MVDPTTGSSEITQDDKTMAMVAWLIGIVTGWVGPLIIYLVKKDQSKFVAYHALQATFFHVAIIVLYMASAFTFLISGAAGVLLSLVFSIIAGLAANRGEWYEVPLIGKFTKQQVGISV